LGILYDECAVKLLRSRLQIGQAESALAKVRLVEAAPVVKDCQSASTILDLDRHARLGGMRVTPDVRQRFSDDGHEVLSHLSEDGRVHRTIECDLNVKADNGAQLSDHRNDVISKASILATHAELIDGGTDPIDDTVDFGHRLHEPRRHDPWSSTGHALEVEADPEKPLDHGVMQIPGEAISVLVDGDHLDLLMKAGVLDGDTGRQGEHFDKCGVIIREL
jgi:hypothetical protein